MARHAKTDSDVTSLAPSSPRLPAYYVHSPAASHPDAVASTGCGGGGCCTGASADKMSLAGSTPAESPLHYHFHHSGAAMHHSRESSTGRLLFSDQLRLGGAAGAVPWRRLGHGSGAGSAGDDDEEDGGRPGSQSPWRCYALAAFAFVAVFAFFLLVLWGASKSYKPHVDVKSVVFESYHIQGGTDRTGVPTRMMSVNATVRLRFRNRGTFFGLHVTAAPFHLFFDDLTVATGNMREFYQARKSGRLVTVSVVGKQFRSTAPGPTCTASPTTAASAPRWCPSGSPSCSGRAHTSWASSSAPSSTAGAPAASTSARPTSASLCPALPPTVSTTTGGDSHRTMLVDCVG